MGTPRSQTHCIKTPSTCKLVIVRVNESTQHLSAHRRPGLFSLSDLQMFMGTFSADKIWAFIRAAANRLEIEAKYRYRHHVAGIDLDGPPTYIVGCGHSGTSLLLAILGAHSRFYAVPFESYLAFKSVSEQEKLFQKFERQALAAGKRCWIEKTPKHVRRIDDLFDLTPDARILVMLRDGRDVACSIRARTNDFEQGVERWLQDNRIAEEYRSHSQVHWVHYEDIVVDFDGALKDTLDFLDESFEPRLHHYHEDPKHYYDQKVELPESAEDHEQLRNWQINQPVFDGRGRWETEMSKDEKALFKERAGEMLVRYNYADNLDW